MPYRTRHWSVFLATILIPLIGLVLARCGKPTGWSRNATATDGYLFCFWNVENLFDDKYDGHSNEADKEYDSWFAHDPAILHEKLDHLSKAPVALNEGKGPDILAVAEVESERAAELLRDALNERLDDPSLHYQHVLMREVSAGRHIAPAIIMRLPVQANKSHMLNKSLRILEGHIEKDGHDLVVLASHWTSRLRNDSTHGRDKYAELIYGHVKGMYMSNPHVDVLVCGDFNDTPEDVSVVRYLHATGDITSVRDAGNELQLLDLFAGKDPNHYGTHYYHKWFIFDHIVISPGMLDEQGWSCDPDSVQTVNTLYDPRDLEQRPWHFGNPNYQGARGYSDHFPVTVRLKVHGN